MRTARIPLSAIPERLALYEAGLADSGLDDEARRRLREQAAVWRFVYVADSQDQAEDDLASTLQDMRHHMIHARPTHNPADFRVDPGRVNPWLDPLVSDDDSVRYALKTATLYGTAQRVADQVAEMRAAGVHHILCQMSYGFLPHAKIMESMRRFGEHVMPRFR